MKHHPIAPMLCAALCVFTLAGCASSLRGQGPPSATAKGTSTATATGSTRPDPPASCPQTINGSNLGGATRGGALEPLNADELLICGYRRTVDDGTATMGIAAHSQTGDPTTIRSLRQVINALPGPPSASEGCGNGNAGVVLLIFSSGGSSVRLLENMGGCQTVTDGTTTGWVGSTSLGTSVMALLPESYCRSVWALAACDPPSPPSPHLSQSS